MAAASVGFQFIEREFRVATEGLELPALNAALAQFAKEELARALGEGASQNYETFVNGQRGRAETSVIAPGPIVYVFTNWPLIISTAIEELRKRSPRRSGRFMNSFIVLANQQLTTDYAQIPPNAEVIVTNRQPYVRKIETGANKSLGERMFALTRNALNRRFKDAFTFETKFLDIQSGVAPGVPWILKRSAGGRRDRQAGMPISYPSIVINAL
jgi:hypothetical protein